ncbi:MAG: helix-turn-helix domain-containing protein [Patescibacteria group bacterium]
MSPFTPKRLPLDETIGERLRQARHYRNLKIEEVAKRLNIRAEYLAALEAEDLDKLPAGLYGKNFLKEYASFLGLKTADIANYWQQRGDRENSDPFSQKIVKKHKFIIFPRIVRNILVLAAVLICFLYLISYFKQVVLPPALSISQPSENLVTASDMITISGQTEAEAEVKINGQIVLNNYNGYFTETVNLKKGLNNITITAQKKYSQTKTVNRQILVE